MTLCTLNEIKIIMEKLEFLEERYLSYWNGSKFYLDM